MQKASFSILLTVPSLKRQGGVSGFYNSALSHFPKGSIIPFEIGGIKSAGAMIHPLRDQVCFRSKLNQVNPDLIHINPSLGWKSFWRDGLFAWQTKRKRKPLLVFFHGWNHGFAKVVEERFLRFFNNTYARADCFVVLASEFKEQLTKWGVKAPIFIETTLVDEQLLRDFNFAEKKTFIRKPKTIRILFLSRLEKEKGVFETIYAIKLLQDKGVNVNLTIAGDGSARKEAEQLVCQLELENYICFLGYVRGKEKIEVFTNNDIYCLPSYGEGLPVSLLEAIAFGMPVVTSSVGGLKDVFQNGKMGFFTNSLEPKDIAQQLEKLIENPVLSKQISVHNFEYAQHHFMASQVVKRIVDIYQEVIFNNIHR